MCRVVLILVTLWSTSALARTEKKWVLEEYKDFRDGKTEGLRITSLGELKTGWDTDRVDTDGLGGIWSTAMLNGKLYLGTDDGKIYSLANNGKPKLVTTIKSAIAITAMAEGDDGAIYAGTMPGGEIWRIPAKGPAKKVASLKKAETVWSLTFHKNKNLLFAGTGPDARLFSVNPQTGSTSVVSQVADKRIMSVAVDARGSVWFGTSEEALVYKYDPATKITRAMADFSGNEVSAITAFSQGVAVAANDLKRPPKSGPKSRTTIRKAKGKLPGHTAKMPRVGTKPGADKAPTSSTEVKRPGAMKGKGALYYIRPDGAFEQMHALTATYFTSLATNSAGHLFAGAADKGRVYILENENSSATAFDVDERVIVSISSENGKLAFATYDSSACYFVGGSSRKGSYESDVFDAKNIATYGKLSWFGNPKATIQTRSGNTAEAGKGWSKWRNIRGIATSAGGYSWGQIGSPRGRYFQFKVLLDSGAISRAEVFYRPQNIPTKIENITATSDGADALSVLSDKPINPRSRVIKLRWKVDNDDGDKTGYVIEARREGSAAWRKLPLKKSPHTQTNYKWNTEALEDGFYRVRITASDRLENPTETARSHTKISRPIAVDNNGPKLTGVRVSFPAVAATVRDDLSVVREAAYSIDDGPWRLTSTRDGLFDEPTEQIQFSLPKDLARGSHTITIRVADDAGNISQVSKTFSR